MTLTPCSYKDCKETGWGMIWIVDKKIRKGFSAPGAKGYALCVHHANTFMTTGQIQIQDY